MSGNLDKLIHDLKTGDTRTCKEAAIALGILGDTRAVEPLIAVLGDEHRSAQVAAIEALGQLKDTRAVIPLVLKLNSSVWSAAFKALTSFGELAVSPLVEALHSSDSQMRLYATRALGRLRLVTAKPALVAILDDPYVGFAAAVSLALLGDRTFLDEKQPDPIRVALIIVDDIPEMREITRVLLAFEDDIEVVAVAGTGHDGIECARQYKPNIVLMDINMPDMDGITAASSVIQEVPTAQVIMVSVQSEADYLRRAMLAGARDFVTKPFSAEELILTIRRVHKMAFVKASLPLKVSTITSLEILQNLERLDAYKYNLVLGRTLDELEKTMSGIPHDLREPLSVARNILDELLEESSTVIGDETINQCGCRLDYALLLVDRLISVTSCGEPEVRSRTSVAQVLEHVVPLVKSSLERTLVQVDIKKEDLKIQIKSTDLYQILACLLENALESAPELEHVEVNMASDINNCHIRVLDTGQGIKRPGLLCTLGYTTKPGHAGLGLYVCKRLVTRYRGQITIDNRTNGEGVLAEVVLPTIFQQRVWNQNNVDPAKGLEQYRGFALTPHEKEAVETTTQQIVIAFAMNLSSVIADVRSAILEVMTKPAAQPNDQWRRASQSILRNCNYAQSVAGSLLEPSSPDQIRPVHLRTVLFEVLALFETKLPSQSISLDVEDQIWIMADHTLFQRCFFNLARNALEAMRRQGQFQLTINAKVQENLVAIQFIDIGVGISEENFSKLFQRGFSTKAKGRGFGLYVVKSIIDQHQGRIEVQSKVGAGTCFTVYWPLAQLTDAVSMPAMDAVETTLTTPSHTHERVDATVPDTPTTKPARILLVEDDSTWLEIAVRRLQSPDYSIIQTRKAADAVRLMQEKRCDLVLLDWNMPGIGGIGVLEKAREMNLDIPIMILSAYGDPEQQANALRLGAKSFIRKPENKAQWDELKRTVSESLPKPVEPSSTPPRRLGGA